MTQKTINIARRKAGIRMKERRREQDKKKEVYTARKNEGMKR